eukprot:TRINITY_DN16301_c0_g1_i1.p1 TRINITY_DN16301_c0_g1~~TRINITY_DN16301_c0_g1_i1.p1  ORF type:complete len:147 (-),score=13.92 TRINITY_DN16301_c0_g1_i1:36-437(-)
MSKLCNSCGREILNTSTVSTKAKDGTVEYFHPWCLRCDQCGTQFGKGKVYMDPDNGRRYCSRNCYDNGQDVVVTDPKSNYRSEQEASQTKPKPMAAQPAAQNNPPANRPNNCGNCGSKVAPHNKFCGSCGSPL